MRRTYRSQVFAGYAAEFDLVGRGLKAQMRYADKIKAKFVCVLGDNELETGVAKIKNMRTGTETETVLTEFMETFAGLLLDEVFGTELIEEFGDEAETNE